MDRARLHREVRKPLRHLSGRLPCLELSFYKVKSIQGFVSVRLVGRGVFVRELRAVVMGVTLRKIAARRV